LLSPKDDARNLYFDEPSPEIVNELAIRYEIELVYQAMALVFISS
jgi:hypothetical protein